MSKLQFVGNKTVDEFFVELLINEQKIKRKKCEKEVIQKETK